MCEGGGAAHGGVLSRRDYCGGGRFAYGRGKGHVGIIRLKKNQDLEEQLANAKAQTKTEVVESLLSPELFIRFPFNKSTLSGEARVTLTNLANLLNALDDVNVVYKISGYADQQTGSEKSNLKLSQARAQAVYDYLVNELGVAPEKLEIEAVGGVDTMYYNDNRLSRAVILTIKK